MRRAGEQGFILTNSGLTTTSSLDDASYSALSSFALYSRFYVLQAARHVSLLRLSLLRSADAFKATARCRTSNTTSRHTIICASPSSHDTKRRTDIRSVLCHLNRIRKQSPETHAQAVPISIMQELIKMSVFSVDKHLVLNRVHVVPPELSTPLTVHRDMPLSNCSCSYFFSYPPHGSPYRRAQIRSELC